MRRSHLLLGVYLAALLGSHVYQAGQRGGRQPRGPETAGAGPGRTAFELPAMDDSGPRHPGAGPSGSIEDPMHVSVISWLPPAEGGGGAQGGRLPVLLLHGSPGSGRNFEDLGGRLAASGRRAYAPDLPGFGRSTRDVPSYSIRAHAHAALATLDALGIERAHVATWSMGGGVGLHMVELAPERVASLTQIASIGVQEAEGSGDYYFEHLKYALLFVGLEVLPELVPHFGLLGPRGRARGFVRNFWDTDQRPLRGIMERSGTPTLILQGRDDFLVPAWAAEVSHELIGPSRLVMLDASHFLLFEAPHGQLEQTLEQLLPFLERHDVAGVPVERAYLDLAPAPRGLERAVLPPYGLMRALPWWLLGLALLAVTLAAPRAGPFAAGLAVAGLQLDFGLALVFCALGGGCARRSARRRGRVRSALAAGAWSLGGAIAGGALGGFFGLALPQLLAPCALALAAWRRLRSRHREAGGPAAA